MSPTEIKQTRQKLGLSQGKLAAVLNTHPMTISKWETGKREPDGAALAALDMLAFMQQTGSLGDYLTQVKSPRH